MKPSAARVAEINAPAVADYKAMRDSLLGHPDLDRTICEIVITTQLALLGHEVAFKLHAQRLFDMKVSREQLEGYVLAGLGVTWVIPHAAKVLDWILQADEMHRASAGASGAKR